MVGAQEIKYRLQYQPLSWFRPTYAIVAGNSISHHHRHSAWQRTELQREYGEEWITEMGWAMAAYWDGGVAEMGCTTGSICSGDPGVDGSQLASHLVSSHLTSSYHIQITHSIVPSLRSDSFCPRSHGSTQLHASSRPGSIFPSYPLPMLLEPEPLFLTNSFWMPREVWRSVDNGLSAF